MIHCPRCGHDNITWSYTNRCWECPICGEPWSEDWPEDEEEYEIYYEENRCKPG